MSNSISYLIVLLKDQTRALTSLIHLSREEQKSLRGNDVPQLIELLEKKKRITEKLKSLEAEKLHLWEKFRNLLDLPTNPIQKFQSAQCKILALKHKSLLNQLAQINLEKEPNPQYQARPLFRNKASLSFGPQLPAG